MNEKGIIKTKMKEDYGVQLRQGGVDGSRCVYSILSLILLGCGELLDLTNSWRQPGV